MIFEKAILGMSCEQLKKVNPWNYTVLKFVRCVVVQVLYNRYTYIYIGPCPFSTIILIKYTSLKLIKVGFESKYELTQI